MREVTMRIDRLLPTCLANPQDLERINELLRQLSNRAKPKTREQILACAAKAEIYIARDDQDTILGMASLFIMEKLIDREGMVEDVVVLEEHRGKGIGERLMHALIDRARELELTSLNLTSNPQRVAAIALYEKLGFKKRTTNVMRLEF